MNDYRELLIGCGHQRDKRMDPRDFQPRARPAPSDLRQWRGTLHTLDYMSQCNPDFLCDLERIPWAVYRPVETLDGGRTVFDPLPESTYDEVHAYEVLEHLGRQGDFRSFFAHFSEIWRVLKPGGYLCATVPSRYSQWMWGDPGHTRAVLPCELVFLVQPNYVLQQGKTSMSDYRSVYRADFEIVGNPVDDHETHKFVLQAVKPSRVALP
jgi:SAM-dependent methyltransferase